MAVIADLSHHQGDIDWSKLSKVLDLAVIRVQYGSTTIDRKYKEYVAEAKKYKVPFGHYAYARFVSIADAKKEAEDFLARIDKDAKFLVVDVEEQTCRNPKDIVPATQMFIDTCKKAGYKVGLYTGHHFWLPHGMSKVKADFVWIPRYSSNDTGKVHDVKPALPCDLWQYTQNGKLDGIKGHVDLNILNGSKPLSFFTGEVPKPAPKPAPLPKTEKDYEVVEVTEGITLYKAVRVLKKGERYKKYGENIGMDNLGGDLFVPKGFLKVVKED